MPLTTNPRGALGDGARKIIATLVGILLVYSIFFLGTLIRNNLKRYDTIGRLDRAERTLNIDAQGRVTTAPDIALTSMGMIASAKTVSEAQQKNTTAMNKLSERLRALGVDAKDVQTSYYNINPQYDYTDGRSQLRGYEVSQSVTVKVRNIDKASQVLALAGELGLNNVSGLQFTIDDPEKYRAQAREEALQKIAAKAKSLEKMLGVRLREVVAYNEYEGGSGPGPVYAAYDMRGIGGGGEKPQVEPGSTDVLLNVSVVFAIR